MNPIPTVIAWNRGTTIRTEPFIAKYPKGKPDRITEPDIQCNGYVQFEIHYHEGEKRFVVERFYLPNLGDYAFFAHSIEECISWIEATYSIKLKVLLQYSSLPNSRQSGKGTSPEARR